jgi:hypothetical protein
MGNNRMVVNKNGTTEQVTHTANRIIEQTKNNFNNNIENIKKLF